MSNYEMMVIFKPQLMDDEKKAPLKNFEALIKQNKGKIISSDDWGEKNMVYQIEGHERGYYVVYQLELDSEKIKGLSAKMNLNKDLLRWLLLDVEEEEVIAKEEAKTDEKKEKSS